MQYIPFLVFSEVLKRTEEKGLKSQTPTFGWQKSYVAYLPMSNYNYTIEET